MVQCYNCGIFGHYAVECRKLKKNKEQRQEVNMTQVEDEEPALLLAKCVKRRRKYDVAKRETSGASAVDR